MNAFLFRDLRGSLAMRSLWVFCASLFLGISLISACAGLLGLVRDGLDQQSRLLFGGDVEVSTREALDEEALSWLRANGTPSRLLEMRTMVGSAAGGFTVAELQSVDAAYPLYGEVRLEPAITLEAAVARSASGTWGAAFDPVLAERLGVAIGERVLVGEAELELRALIVEQPDRSLRADVGGPPLLVADGALEASGLLGGMILADYEYRVRIDGDPDDWRESLRAAFPSATWEVRTVEERGELVAERLDQVASVLLLIGFATLLIGGLGVANGIGAYLQSKFHTLATLQSLGARARQIAHVFIGQTLVLALLACSTGALAGAAVAWFAARTLAERLPISTAVAALLPSTALATALGVLGALAFAMPTLGRTLRTRPALLLRGASGTGGDGLHAVPHGYRIATLGLLAGVVALLLIIVPEPLIGVAFVAAVGLLLLALEGIVALIRRLARALGHSRLLEGRFAPRMALAALHRPGTALRPLLLSLGTALTLLVATALVIAALLNTLGGTIPERAPALAFYDIQEAELAEFETFVRELDGYERLVTTPFVLGRLREVNGERLAESEEAQRALEANDEHKLSYRTPGIDGSTLDRGRWWPADHDGPPMVAMEDREADQLELAVGDRLTFAILDEEIEVTLAAIYSQARFETRFWLEAVFSPGVLDPFVTRHIGSAFFADDTDLAATAAIGAAFPSVVTLRTARAIASARAVLRGASLAVTLVAAVSLVASVLVMASVVAVSRQRQVHEASILHAIGTRTSVVLGSVLYEYALLGLVLALFAAIVGGSLGWAILAFWIELPNAAEAGSPWMTGLAVAFGASTLCLACGAIWLARTLTASPAALLRRAG